jgi:hypothetical protein
MTGEVTPLGTDQGSAYLYGMTNKYIFWGFHCHKSGCDPEDNPPLPTDFYLYDLETRTNRVVSAVKRNGGMSVARLSGDWIAFARPEDMRRAHLYAVNVRTGTDILITDNITFLERESPYVATQGVFDIAGTSVVWTEQENLYRYDLTTGISETLNVPAILTPPRGNVQYQRDRAPRRLHTSERAVVWQSQSEWWGYDFVTGHYFPIPPTIRRPFADETQPRFYYPFSVKVVEDTVYMRVTAYTSTGGREELPPFAAPLVRPGLGQTDGEHTQVYLPLVSNNGR